MFVALLLPTPSCLLRSPVFHVSLLLRNAAVAKDFDELFKAIHTHPSFTSLAIPEVRDPKFAFEYADQYDFAESIVKAYFETFVRITTRSEVNRFFTVYELATASGMGKTRSGYEAMNIIKGFCTEVAEFCLTRRG